MIDPSSVCVEIGVEKVCGKLDKHCKISRCFPRPRLFSNIRRRVRENKCVTPESGNKEIKIKEERIYQSDCQTKTTKGKAETRREAKSSLRKGKKAIAALTTTAQRKKEATAPPDSTSSSL